MRIKQLEVVGFKSFGQKTVLDFGAGITSIVGPNGCGKSNVVDAIRWVLGEQSPKQLRGASMEDVIFKGNDRVAPAQMGQVSLTFENDPDRPPPEQLDLDVSTLPAHFRNLAEITVTRRLFRSGESEYFINKTPCRLKDITELFLGTGVGSKAYAIIEQGRVDQLINAKPEDRRLFIEEAAGTTLYRSRKVAAERKMERTRENLLRVNDVLRELERQIQYLHRMARKAEQYRSLQEELRTLDLNVSGTRWHSRQTRIAELETELDGLRRQESDLVAAVEEIERQRSDRLTALRAAEEDFARQREAAAALDSEVQSLGQQAAMLAKEAEERSRRVERLDAEQASLARVEAELAAGLADQEQRCEAEAAVLRTEEGQLAERESLAAAARADASALTIEVEELKGRLVGLVTREAELRNIRAGLSRREADATRRLEKASADERAAMQQLAELESVSVARRAVVADLRQQLEAVQGEKEERAERVRALSETHRRIERELGETRNRLVQAQSRLESLRQLQRTYAGYRPGVRSVLLAEHDREAVLGVVADVIDVPAPYERAVAAALGERLQYVIVREEGDGVEAVNMLRTNESGRGSFIPLAPRQGALPGVGTGSANGTLRPLLDLVRVDEPYRRIAETLLGDVVLVPDLVTGLAVWRSNGTRVTMVTPDGDVIDACGVITGGSECTDDEEMVARRRVVSELTLEEADGEQRIAALEREASEVAERREAEETALRAVDANLHRLTLELVAAEREVERVEAERPRWLDRLEVARFDAAAAAAERVECAAEIATVDADTDAAGRERHAADAALGEVSGRAAALSARSEALAAEVTDTKVRVAEYRQRQHAASDALNNLRKRCEDVRRGQESAARERAHSLQARVELEAAARDVNAQSAARAEQRRTLEASIGAAKAALEAMAAELDDLDRSLRESRRGLEATREALSQCDLKLAEERLHAAHLADGIRERYGVDLAAYEVPLEFVADEAAGTRLEALRERIARIGEVHVGAIDELRELEERARFLRGQKEDLERSLADLERTIHRLNRASRARFIETFNAVNERFQQIVPQLFRGGEARLTLTDEHNLLESGVDVVLRPPGKRLETISLLSGGEKALGAVSLIVALFLINPTPFCILDEVDAPLDDANIGRFTSLVKSMSERSQFIMITHNKHTMQAADVLYGVTMEEPGLSKVISVAMR